MIAQTNMAFPELVEDLSLLTAPGDAGLHWAWYVVGVVALLALVIPLYLAFRPRPGEKSAAVQPAGPDPAQVANGRLSTLRKNLAHLSQREAGIELASVLRDYISGRFDIRAPYQTTGEFVGHLRLTDHFPSAQSGPVVDLLNTFDLVKFATGILQEGTLEQWIDYVGEFVRNTSKPMVGESGQPGEVSRHG